MGAGWSYVLNKVSGANAAEGKEHLGHEAQDAVRHLGGAHIFADGAPARIYVNDGYRIAGNAAYEWAATAGGGIDLSSSATITCNGSMSYSGHLPASQ
jgi:hypothetical protein